MNATSATSGGVHGDDRAGTSVVTLPATPDTTRKLALTYAEQGIPAGPIAIGWDEKKQKTNKRPLTQHGHQSFTTVEKLLTLDLFKNAAGRMRDGEVLGVGLYPGRAGFAVLDPDVGDPDGREVLAKLEADHGTLPPHPIVDTASGGEHRWFRKPDGTEIGNPDFADGINVRADDGWVVAPGTITPWGSWTLRDGTPLADAPEPPRWVLDRLDVRETLDAALDGGTSPFARPARPGGKGRWQPLDPDALDPRDRAALNALEALGGTGAYLDSDGAVLITRPGKTAGASASIGHIGPGIVKIFTDEWAPLEQNARYDADQLADLADSPSSSQSPAHRVRLTRASTIKPRPVRWTWKDRIPTGEITLTPGRGGIGKSTFHAHLIAKVSRGTLTGMHFGTPRLCIIAATEDSWERTIVPRLIAAGADMDLVCRVDVVTETEAEVSISLPRDLDGLAIEIEREAAAVLSVDPLLGVVSSALDTHKDADVRQALTPLARLADRTGVSVLGNAHFNKGSGSDPLSLVMGSAAFGNVARAALGFARDTEADDGTCVISQVKNNLGRLDLASLSYRIDPAFIDTPEGEAEVGKLVMLGESARSVADILRDHGGSGERTERDNAKDFLREALGDSALPSKDVQAAAKDADLAWRTVRRAADALGVKRIHPDIKGPWYWELPLQDGHQGGLGVQEPESGHVGQEVDTLDEDNQTLWKESDISQDAVEVGHQEAPRARGVSARMATARAEMGICEICGHNMWLIEDGQTTHPACEENP